MNHGGISLYRNLQNAALLENTIESCAFQVLCSGAVCYLVKNNGCQNNKTICDDNNNLTLTAPGCIIQQIRNRLFSYLQIFPLQPASADN